MTENHSKIKHRITTPSKIMTETEWQVSSEIIAKLVARAYATEHPELFGPNLGRVIGGQVDGK